MKYLSHYFLIGLMVAIAQFTWAQASLEITLLDSLNNAVSTQPVLITNQQIGYSVQRTSNMQGKILLDGLATSGVYRVAVQDGSFYKARVLDNIALISNKRQSVTLRLSEKVTSLEGITITAGAYHTINTVDAEVASELSSKEIREIPVEGRDITRALYRLPNITQATGFFPEAPNVSVNGANSLYTNYQIDGMDNNENFLGGQRFAMPVGFTQNITALTNNFSAEHGLTSNGIINITTKSGTNEISGEAFYVTRPGPSLDASSPFAQRDLSGNQVKDGFARHQFGFGLGGPLKKDKTFYFINAEHTTDIKDNLLNIPQLGINETVRGNNHFTFLSAKIDQHWNSKLRSSLRVNKGIVNIERQGGGLDGGVTLPSAGNQQDRNTLNIALKNTFQGDGFTYEGNYLYGRFKWDYANPENNLSPDVTILDPSGVTLAVLGHPGFVFDETENTHVIQQKITFQRENHRFKTGLQFKNLNYELFGGGNPNGSYLVQVDPSQLNLLNGSGKGSALQATDIPQNVQVLTYNVELRPNSFEKTQRIYSIYFEDQFSLSPRMNLNLGVRYDYDNLSKGGASSGDYNNIAPRLSANYKLNERSSLRAGYGIYYDKILYAVYSDALQFSSTSADFQRQVQALVDLGRLPANTQVSRVVNVGNLVAGANNVAFLQGPTADQLQGKREDVFSNELRILNPSGYDNPYSHQFMIGYQQKLNEHTMFYLDLMHNRSHNLFRLRDLNTPAPFPIDPANVTLRTTQQADATRPIPIQSDATGNFAVLGSDTLRGISRNVTMTEAAGRANYYAMNFTLQRGRADDKYSFRLMYTLSFLENNTEDINFRAMDANNFDTEWGASINDRTHLINGIVNYFPTKNVSFTLAALLQSGQPINRIPDAAIYGTTDLNGDGRSFGDAYVGNSDRQPGEERNSGRLPWSTTFDLSAFYHIPVTERGRIEAGAQIFNLFNAENLSGYANNATQSNQIQVGPESAGTLVRRNAGPPRQFQFSIRYVF